MTPTAPARRGRAVLPALVAVLALLITAATAHADRAFTPRFKANDTGDIVMAANTLLSCLDDVPPATGCADARAGKAGAKLGNNAWNMRFVDVDSDAATFNSSRADVVLPADASILFAGLYWGANTRAGASGGRAANRQRSRTAFGSPRRRAAATSR